MRFSACFFTFCFEFELSQNTQNKTSEKHLYTWNIYTTGPGCSKPDYANSSRVSENFDFSFVIFWWGILFILFALQFCSNLKLHQTLQGKIIFKQENIMLQLTFHSGLTLSGLRRLERVFCCTRPRNLHQDARVSWMN